MGELTTTRPETIFKYQPINVQSLNNLQSQCIYFCSPSQFNDPYDCAISAHVKKLRQSEVKAVKEQYLKELDKDSEEEKELSKMSRLHLREFLNRVVIKFVENHRLEFIENKGVSCFTETNDNILMWSHYADSGRGMCLEFNTESEPFTQSRKVDYLDEIPELDALPMLIEDDFEQFINLFCTKSDDWEYENEWRCLHGEAGTKFGFESKALKAIYFGPEVDASSSNIVGLILHGQNPGVKLYRGETSKSEFKVEFTEVKYAPWKD